MIVLTSCLVLAGCLSLALSQERNWKSVTGMSAVSRTQAIMRLAGWMLLAAALGVSLAVEGAGFAVLQWTLQVAVACVIVAMMLSYKPASIRPVARVYTALRR